MYSAIVITGLHRTWLLLSVVNNIAHHDSAFVGPKE
jgi:hypothetical protein